MGNNQSEEHDFKISEEQCQYPLKFNYDFDKGLHISPNQLFFRKFDHGRATVVSDRPLMRNEIICVKVAMFHKGTLKFGITSINPEHINASEFEGMILNNLNSLKLKMLPKKSLQKDNLLFFQYADSGEVMFGWYKKGRIREKMLLLEGLHVNTPQWAVLDVFGKNVVLRLENELIPILASVPPELMKAQNVSQIYKSLENVSKDAERNGRKDENEKIRRALSCNKLEESEVSNTSGEALNDNQLSSQNQASQLTAITDFSKFFKLPLSTLDQFPVKHNIHPSYFSPTHHHLMPSSSTPNNTTQHNRDTKTSLTFHTTIGKNVSLTPDQLSASRTANSTNNNAYVFTQRPILVDEAVIVSINAIDSCSKKGLGFGMTVSNPAEVGVLPDDGDDLLDRGDYWVYVRDVMKSPLPGDELSFPLSRRGRVSMVRKGSEEKTIVHVDPSVPMWMFFDLTGCVRSITCLGVTKRQSVKRDTTVRNSNSFQRFDDTITIPARPSPTPPLTISSSIDIAEQALKRNGEARRNSTNSLRPKIPPRPSIFISPQATTNPPATPIFLSMDLPSSLTAPLIPLPPRLLSTLSKSPSDRSINPTHSSSVPLNPFSSSSYPPASPSHSPPIPSQPPPSLVILPSSTSQLPPVPFHPKNRSQDLAIPVSTAPSDQRTIPLNHSLTNLPSSTTTSPTSHPNETKDIRNLSIPTDFSQSISPMRQQDVQQLLQQIQSLKEAAKQQPCETLTTNSTQRSSIDQPPNSPECSICLDLPPDTVLYTCGHMCLCHSCATDVINSPTPYCPICRKEIKDIVKIYRS